MNWVEHIPKRDLSQIHHGLRLAAKFPGLDEETAADLERIADVCWNEHVRRCDPPVTARIYSEGALTWWAELWTPPPTGIVDPCEGLPPIGDPPGISGMRRVAITLHHTRRGARKDAVRMLERYRAGQPLVDSMTVATLETIEA